MTRPLSRRWWLVLAAALAPLPSLAQSKVLFKQGTEPAAMARGNLEAGRFS